VIVNGGDEDAVDSRLPMQTARMSLAPVRLVNIVSGGEDELDSLDGRTVHAVAGISNPQRFFDTLTGLGCQVVPHQFPDHHLFVESDLEFDDDLPVIMTEKDAVKLNRLAFASHHNQFWYLEVDAILPETEINGLLIRTGLLPVANGV
ncbi:MAG: tetraacyldisaccharide 4'-kinase, partial [Gammaproteobacteria bacterium]